MVVKVYYSSVSSNMEIKKKQQRIRNVLDGKKIEVEYVDMSSDPKHKDEMRELMKDPKALPPQIFIDNEYLGNYDAFDEAVEMGTLLEWLKLSS